MNTFRAPAYPLITVDPYFSIWSCADTLEETYTKHWTGRPAPIYLEVTVDDEQNRICCFDKNYVNRYYSCRMDQTDVKVNPLSTVYTFENDKVKLVLDFTTPLLLDRPEIFSRPVSYIAYSLTRKDGKTGNVRLTFGISSQCCVDNADEKVEIKKTDFSLCCGNANQNPLAYSGDSVLPNWGYLHLCEKEAYAKTIDPDVNIDIDKTYSSYGENPYLVVDKTDENGVITVAYDEIKALSYFNKPIDEYYTKYFNSFEEMVKTAQEEYPKIKKMCNDFEKQLIDEASEYGEHYKTILALTYRQAVASHKLAEDDEGNILFLSKECHSNGCIGTLDVTYPSIPIFLKYNPKLIPGMLRPIIKYAQSDIWEYPFAPHDVGQYPLADGQVYGENRLEKQMPVEECGNMLICVAALTKFTNGDKGFFNENKEILKQWADYLVEFGYNPGNQLCTDDFAGHLDHNCNLSVKAILGIASYGELSGDSSYTEIAKKYAKQWETDAKAKKGTRLTFDNPDSWSLKYNMVWDNILGYKLFSDKVKKEEIKLYKSKCNRYGVPLDCREDYTKLDWLMWSTCLYDDKAYFKKVCEGIYNMLNETRDRVPCTDLYCTKKAYHYYCQNRTVVGGVFINLL